MIQASNFTPNYDGFLLKPFNFFEIIICKCTNTTDCYCSIYHLVKVMKLDNITDIIIIAFFSMKLEDGQTKHVYKLLIWNMGLSNRSWIFSPDHFSGNPTKWLNFVFPCHTQLNRGQYKPKWRSVYDFGRLIWA